jgi:hypothetical protein
MKHWDILESAEYREAVAAYEIAEARYNSDLLKANKAQSIANISFTVKRAAQSIVESVYCRLAVENND